MKISLLFISCFAQVGVNSAKKIPARYRHLLAEIANGSVGEFAQPRLGYGYGKSGCDESQEILIRGIDVVNETYSLFLFEDQVNFIPVPGDRELFNLPLLDPVPFETDGTVKIIGWVQEDDAYVPLANDEEPDCIGHSTWSFDKNANGILNQVADQYTCEGFAPVGTGRTGISGGTGKYECAEGVIEKVRVVDPAAFLEGTGGFVIWRIVNCGKCDKGGTGDN